MATEGSSVACTRRANCPCHECMEAMAAMAEFMPRKPAMVLDDTMFETAPPSPSDAVAARVESSEAEGEESNEVRDDTENSAQVDTAMILGPREEDEVAGEPEQAAEEPAAELVAESEEEESEVAKSNEEKPECARPEGAEAEETLQDDDEVEGPHAAVNKVKNSRDTVQSELVAEPEKDGESCHESIRVLDTDTTENIQDQEETVEEMEGESKESAEDVEHADGDGEHNGLYSEVDELADLSSPDGGENQQMESETNAEELRENSNNEEVDATQVQAPALEPKAQDDFTAVAEKDGRVEGDLELDLDEDESDEEDYVEAHESEANVGEIARSEPSFGEIKPSESQANEQDANVGSRTGRRRRRVSGGLGMMDAYSSGDNAPKYSQREVDALLSAKSDEFEKSEKEIRNQYESQMAVMQTMLTSAQHEAATSCVEATKSQEQEALILELSQRLEDLETTHYTNLMAVEKDLTDKKVQLDVITQQYMGMKSELALQAENFKSEREKHELEVKSLKEELAARQDALLLLQRDFDNIHSAEREKRMTAVLKMKDDMRDLAEKQFAEANKMYRALQKKLKDTMQALETANEVITDSSRREASLREKLEKASQEEVNVRASAREEVNTANSKLAILASELETLKAEMRAKDTELEVSRKSAAEAENDRRAAQDSLARMAVRNTELQAEVGELKEVSEQLLSMVENK